MKKEIYVAFISKKLREELPNAWRLIYAIETNKIKIMNIILE